MNHQSDPASAYSVVTTDAGPQVRFAGVPLPYIDPASFTALGGSYGRDRRFAYWQGRIIDDCRREALVHLGGDFASDGERIYRLDSPMPVDPASFAVLAEPFVRDATRVFVYDRPIPGADPDSAEVLDAHHLRDAHTVYYLERRIPDVHRESFVSLGARYARDRTAIYCNGQRLAGVDPDRFRLFEDAPHGSGYATDGANVYLEGAIVTDADAASFTLLRGYYGCDRAHVYYFGYRVAEADAASFRCLDAEGFAIDRANLFYRQHRLAPAVDDFAVLTTGADAMRALEAAVYYRYDGAIYALAAEDFAGFHQRLAADPATFSWLGGAYARDARSVFYHGTRLADCDPASFRDLGLGYCCDAHAVYLDGHRLEGADPASFRICPCGWSHDRDRVYLDAEQMPQLTPTGFAVVNTRFARDRDTVVHHDARMMIMVPLAGAHAPSFEPIAGPYARDREHVYRGEEAIAGADPASFTLARHGWAHDARRSYYGAEAVEGVDRASFVSIDDMYAIDEHRLYWYGRPQPCDRASFTIIDTFFCKDRERVWFEGALQSGIDAPSFAARTIFYYVDKHRVYERCTPLPLTPEETSFPAPAYALGARAVYFLDTPLPEADPASFAVLANNFSKDAHRVYYRDRLIPGADAPSFAVTNYLESCDKHRVYTIRAGEVVVLRER